MGNNGVQKNEVQKNEVQQIQGIQYSQVRRAQNGGVPQTHNRRAGSQREQYMRQQQQMQQQQKSLKKRIGILSFLVYLIFLLNLVTAVSMYFRIQRVYKVLEIVEGKSLTGMSEGGMDSEWIFSDLLAGADVSPAAKEQAVTNSGTVVTGQDYIDLCGLEYVDRPQERTMEQVLERLSQLAECDERITEILENSYKYPDKLLEALANNPEMTDFVMGYEDNAGKVSGALTREEMKQDFPLFLQWDPRWGYGEYGDGSHIALTGCGPACLSMALFYLTRDESLTPDKIAEYSMENGYYISGTGTAWALMEDVPEKYGIYVSQPKAEEYTMKTALDNGSVMICSMGPGDFTAGGHFIVIYGYDGRGFLVNDPNCIARSRQAWNFSELKGQIKNIWVLGDPLKYGGVTSMIDYVYDESK